MAVYCAAPDNEDSCTQGMHAAGKRAGVSDGGGKANEAHRPSIRSVMVINLTSKDIRVSGAVAYITHFEQGRFALFIEIAHKLGEDFETEDAATVIRGNGTGVNA